MDEHCAARECHARTLDGWGLAALAVAAVALIAAYLTEHHMGMGLFMGLFIAFIAGAILLLGYTRVRSPGRALGAGAD